MSIRFACTNCRQALGIAARKAGSTVRCPKCQTEQTVPTMEPPAAIVHSVAPLQQADVEKQSAQATSSAAPKVAIRPSVEGSPSFSSLTIEIATPIKPSFSGLVFDEVGAALDTPPARAAAAATTLARTSETHNRSLEGRNQLPVDRSLVAIPRKVLYAQAILIAVVAVAAFSIGYLSGRGPRQPTPEELAAREQPVAVIGDVLYRNAAGEDAPDAGAVVIAVAHDAGPGQKFAIAGLRPTDPTVHEGEANLAVQAIESAGGGFSRADVGGQFRMHVRPGKYLMLVISANVARPAGVLPTTRDVRTLGRYFHGAADLLADRRYTLVEQQLPSDEQLEFALDAK